VRAVWLRGFGPPGVLTPGEAPEPEGDAVIDVEYANLTFVETQVRAGRAPNPGRPGNTGWKSIRPASWSSCQTAFGNPMCSTRSPCRWPISRAPTLNEYSPREPCSPCTPGQVSTSSAIVVIPGIVAATMPGDQASLVLGPVAQRLARAVVGAHDERLTTAEVVERGLVAPELWAEIQQVALAIFKRGQAVAQQAGLILVDTKYEFGLIDGQLALIDEIHTPDSSRYWLADNYAAIQGTDEEPENFDKEFLRLWFVRQGYRGEGQPPAMPPNFVAQVAQRYISTYERLTGRIFEPGTQPAAARIRAAITQIF